MYTLLSKKEAFRDKCGIVRNELFVDSIDVKIPANHAYVLIHDKPNRSSFIV